MRAILGLVPSQQEVRRMLWPLLLQGRLDLILQRQATVTALEGIFRDFSQGYINQKVGDRGIGGRIMYNSISD